MFDEVKKRKLFTVYDLVLILAFIAAISLLLLLADIKQGSDEAEILCNGQVIDTLQLKNDTVKHYKINGYSYDIQVKDKSIAVIAADCKDKICLKTGFISTPSHCIICLPSSLVIRINSQKSNDAITY